MEYSKIAANLITPSQIDQAVLKYRALLEKHSPEFLTGPVSELLGQEEFVNEMFRLFRRRVDGISPLIIRRVKVDRTRSPAEALNATGHEVTPDHAIMNAMPRGEGEVVAVIFFNIGRDLQDCDEVVEEEYEKRGLKLADPYSLAAVNQDDPSFSSQRRNSTFWKEASGRRCYAHFDDWGGHHRRALVFECQGHWPANQWFAGLRK